MRRGLRLAALGLIAAAFLVRLPLMRLHAFNPDEFQHLHGAWCIARGLLPYRDYFEHHMPWLPFFLAPFLAFFDVDTNPAAAEAFIFFARSWMWIFSGLALVLTFRLGKLWEGEGTAWTGTVLLGATVMFLDKTLEVRPDVPAVAFLLGSWLAVLAALRSKDQGSRSHMPFVKGGVLLGVALLCTQKVLFSLPASIVWWLFYLLDPKETEPRRRRSGHALWYGAGLVTPLLIVLTGFALQGGRGAFVDSNLLVNLRWPVRFSPEPLIRQLFVENALVVVAGLGGAVTALARLSRGNGGRAGRALVPVQALGLGAGVFIIPIPYAQYFVLLLPLLALLAGSALVSVFGAAARVRGRAVRRITLAAICVVVGASSLPPLRTIVGMLRPPHTRVQDHLDQLRYLLTNSRPDDIVMDGFSGLGVFRPHAYFYFFLHDEIRARLHGPGTRRLLAELRDGLIAPAWVVADPDLLGLPREIVAFFEHNYEPTPVRPFWRRKDLWLDDRRWLDLGEGPTDELAGRGWDGPEREGSTTFRRSQGRRSTIRLPVRDPAGCRQIVVRARSEYPSAVASVRLEVNGAAIGSIHLLPGWRDYALALPGTLLRRGMNVLQLSHDPLPRGADAAYRGLDRVAAVDGITLECARGPR